MEVNMNGEIIEQKNNKLISLNELMDDMVRENNNNSEIYEEYGDKKEATKQINGINGNSAGRYTNNYIHYIIRNEDLEKFITINKKNKGKRKNKK